MAFGGQSISENKKKSFIGLPRNIWMFAKEGVKRPKGCSFSKITFAFKDLTKLQESGVVCSWYIQKHAQFLIFFTFYDNNFVLNSSLI